MSNHFGEILDNPTDTHKSCMINNNIVRNHSNHLNIKLYECYCDENRIMVICEGCFKYCHQKHRNTLSVSNQQILINQRCKLKIKDLPRLVRCDCETIQHNFTIFQEMLNKNLCDLDSEIIYPIYNLYYYLLEFYKYECIQPFNAEVFDKNLFNYIKTIYNDSNIKRIWKNRLNQMIPSFDVTRFACFFQGHNIIPLAFGALQLLLTIAPIRDIHLIKLLIKLHKQNIIYVLLPQENINYQHIMLYPLTVKLYLDRKLKLMQFINLNNLNVFCLFGGVINTNFFQRILYVNQVSTESNLCLNLNDSIEKILNYLSFNQEVKIAIKEENHNMKIISSLIKELYKRLEVLTFIGGFTITKCKSLLQRLSKLPGEFYLNRMFYRLDKAMLILLIRMKDISLQAYLSNSNIKEDKLLINDIIESILFKCEERLRTYLMHDITIKNYYDLSDLEETYYKIRHFNTMYYLPLKDISNAEFPFELSLKILDLENSNILKLNSKLEELSQIIETSNSLHDFEKNMKSEKPNFNLIIDPLKFIDILEGYYKEIDCFFGNLYNSDISTYQNYFFKRGFISKLLYLYHFVTSNKFLIISFKKQVNPIKSELNLFNYFIYLIFEILLILITNNPFLLEIFFKDNCLDLIFVSKMINNKEKENDNLNEEKVKFEELNIFINEIKSRRKTEQEMKEEIENQFNKETKDKKFKKLIRLKPLNLEDEHKFFEDNTNSFLDKNQDEEDNNYCKKLMDDSLENEKNIIDELINDDKRLRNYKLETTNLEQICMNRLKQKTRNKNELCLLSYEIIIKFYIKLLISIKKSKFKCDMNPLIRRLYLVVNFNKNQFKFYGDLILNEKNLNNLTILHPEYKAPIKYINDNITVISEKIFFGVNYKSKNVRINLNIDLLHAVKLANIKGNQPFCSK